MSDTPNAARVNGDAAFDRLTSSLFVGASLAVLAALLLLGPIEAMERLAPMLRALLPAWGR